MTIPSDQSASSDQWQLSIAGTSVTEDGKNVQYRVTKTVTDAVEQYWEVRKKDQISWGIKVESSNSGQEFYVRSSELLFDYDGACGGHYGIATVLTLLMVLAAF